MNAFELLMPDGTPSKVFACGKCRSVSNTHSAAERCCNWKCNECGKDTPRGLTRCHDCSLLAYRQKMLEKLDAAEEVTAWDSWVYTEDFTGDNDGWFESLEHFVEYVEELDAEDRRELPDFVFCSVAQIRKIDLGEAIERACEDGYEDMGSGGFRLEKETQEAIDRFNQANEKALTVFEVDYKRKVRVDWPDSLVASLITESDE